MLSCYRASEATDPESFIAEATSVLARYPEDVARRISYGMPSESKWLPSIAEIREACDRAMAPRRAEERRQAERAHTDVIVGRAAPAESAERRKQVAEEMVARFSNLGADPNKPALLDPRGMPPGPARRDVEERLAKRLNDLKAEYTSKPCAPLSPSAFKRFGE